MSSDLTATVTKPSEDSLQVKGFEALKYNFHFVSGVFDPSYTELAKVYERWGRVLCVIDTSESPPGSPRVG